jgi:hypothetical protein
VGAGPHRLDRRVLADGPRDDDERNVGVVIEQVQGIELKPFIEWSLTCVGRACP